MGLNQWQTFVTNNSSVRVELHGWSKLRLYRHLLSYLRIIALQLHHGTGNIVTAYEIWYLLVLLLLDGHLLNISIAWHQA